MYARTALIALLLLSAGCSRQDAPSSLQAASSGAPAKVAHGAMVTPLHASGNPVAARRRPFASAPDRGDLVAYPQRPVIRHDGAYTWYRADLSEEHALRAIATGRMAITTPDGQRLQFRQERHVEHPSGDLTWVGRLEGGGPSDEVVLTFGEKAVFGSIAQAGKPPLRLTVASGQSWLVETDPRKVAEIRNEATRPNKPDYLLPPPAVAPAQPIADRQAPTASAATAVPATASATNTVDVLLGYTAGFAAANNGAPLTRLNYLVEVTNQAYVNSGVDARVRLVHAMQVNYADNTDNGAALEQLTGFKAPSTRTTPAAAFAELRAAREQYGADLVSLVRKFNTPENGGCGIAWLIGGGQTGIDRTDEFFGYSVVSDGRDAGTDGKNYFCRDETLAHELGHNMGAQHDVATAKGDDGVLQANEYGVYPYSFGYKTAPGSGNFYTVMAYGDTGQDSHRAFSHPGTTFCGGFPCGVANSADNARGLRQAIPTISTFRDAVAFRARAPADFDGDGSSDLLWFNRGLSRVEYSLLAAGKYLVGNAAFAVGAPWVVQGSGHFDDDLRADLFLVDESTRQMRIWLNRGGYFEPVELGGFSAGWQVVALSDMNGDGNDDLIFFNAMSSTVQITTISNGRMGYSTAFQVPAGYSINFAADVDGSGVKDLVLDNKGTRTLLFWLARGGLYEARTFGGYTAGWTLAGFGDINCDGQEDMAWSNDSLGLFEFTRMEGGYAVGSESYYRSPSQRIAAFKKYEGDSCADLLVDNSASASVASWIRGSDGNGFYNYNLAGYGTGWEVR